MNSKGTGSAFREAMAWKTCIATAIAYPCVMAVVLMNPASAVRTAWLYGGLIFFLIVVEIVFSIILSGATDETPDDERDRAIARRSSRYSHVVLSTGVILAIVNLFGQSIALDLGISVREFLADPLLTAHVLIFFVYASEIVHFGTIALDYRRGG